MKKLLFLLSSLVMFSCSNHNTFTIEGEVPQERLEGKWVFIVPLDSAVKAQIGVDSTIIKDHKFRFTGNREYVGDIRIAAHYRYGTENLLVVTEPGTIKVCIDTVSYGGGTRQNDLLQRYKEFMMSTSKVLVEQNQHYRYLIHQGDTAYASALRDSMMQYMKWRRTEAQTFVDKAESGTLHDFLKQLYNR